MIAPAIETDLVRHKLLLCWCFPIWPGWNYCQWPWKYMGLGLSILTVIFYEAQWNLYRRHFVMQNSIKVRCTTLYLWRFYSYLYDPNSLVVKSSLKLLINPNEAVASRVTKLTSIFSEDKSEEVQDLHLDVVLLPLELKLLVVSWHHWLSETLQFPQSNKPRHLPLTMTISLVYLFRYVFGRVCHDQRQQPWKIWILLEFLQLPADFHKLIM